MSTTRLGTKFKQTTASDDDDNPPSNPAKRPRNDGDRDDKSKKAKTATKTQESTPKTKESQASSSGTSKSPISLEKLFKKREEIQEMEHAYMKAALRAFAQRSGNYPSSSLKTEGWQFIPASEWNKFDLDGKIGRLMRQSMPIQYLISPEHKYGHRYIAGIDRSGYWIHINYVGK